MAVDALWRENAADHNAVQYRQMMAGLAGWHIRTLGGSATSGTANGGVLGPVPSATTGPLAVTAGAGLNINIAVGGAMVGGSAGASSAHRGDYFAYNDATATILLTSDPVSTTINLVGIRIKDTAYGEADNVPSITVVSSTSGAEPAVPDNFLTLARVDVLALSATVGTITDRRRQWSSLGGTIVCATDSTLPTVDLWDGMVVLVLSSATANNLPACYHRISGAWVAAGQASRAWTIITDQLLGSDTSFASFTVPGTFTHLQLIVTGRANVAVTATDIGLRVNNSSTVGDYDSGFYYTQNAGGAAGNIEGLGTVSWGYIGHLAGTTATANRAGSIEALIPDYRSTTYSKCVNYRSETIDEANIRRIQFGGVTFEPTGAITQLDVGAISGGAWATAFKSGSRATLLGVR